MLKLIMLGHSIIQKVKRIVEYSPNKFRGQYNGVQQD